MELRVNDILDISLHVRDENNKTIYSVTYFNNGVYSSADVPMPKDFGYLDIEEWIEQDIESFPEISDYEIFDVTVLGEFQSAKIRIKALKEE